jgi:hypothetical protein
MLDQALECRLGSSIEKGTARRGGHFLVPGVHADQERGNGRVGGDFAGPAQARAEGVDGAANAIGIFRRDGDDFAIEFETFFGDGGGNEPEGISRYKLAEGAE